MTALQSSTLADGGLEAMDFTGADGGALATAFGLGCAATWAFIERIVVGPLRANLEKLERDCEAREQKSDLRISQLETLLLLHGPMPLREQLKAALADPARQQEG